MVYRSILPDLLEDVQRDLAGIKTGRESANRGRFWRNFWRRGHERSARIDEAAFFLDCPFCLRQAEIEQDLVQELLIMLSFEEFQTKISASTGFCLPHFTRASREAKSVGQRVALLECQRTCLQRTMEELEELVRKHDYRFLKEPRGEEMTSWRRAAELLVGNRGVR